MINQAKNIYKIIVGRARKNLHENKTEGLKQAERLIQSVHNNSACETIIRDYAKMEIKMRLKRNLGPPSICLQPWIVREIKNLSNKVYREKIASLEIDLHSQEYMMAVLEMSYSIKYHKITKKLIVPLLKDLKTSSPEKDKPASGDEVKTKLILGILTSVGLTVYFANFAYQCAYNDDYHSIKKICIDVPKYTNHRIHGQTSAKASVDYYMLSASIYCFQLNIGILG